MTTKQKFYNKIKIFLQLLVVVNLFLVFVSPVQIAYAQAPVPPTTTNPPTTTTTPPTTTTSTPVTAGPAEKSIGDYLCTPTDTNLYDCINKVYRFSIVVGFVIAVMFIVFAGYLYMTGGEKGITQAKSIGSSTGIALVIMLTSFILLKQINPNLVVFKKIQLPEVAKSDIEGPVKFNVDTIKDPPAGGSGTGGGTTPGPRGDGSIVILPWTSSNHPYRSSGWENTDPALKIAFDKLKAVYRNIELTAAYRPQEYQDHNRSVWDAQHLVLGKSVKGSVGAANTSAYYCPSPEYDFNPPANWAEYKNNVEFMKVFNFESTKHGNGGDTRPACVNSDHTTGIGMDISGNPGGTNPTREFLVTAFAFGLCRNITTDEPHYSLVTKLPPGVHCVDF